MNRFVVYQRWLMLVGAIIVVFGTLLALFSQTPPFAIFRQQIDPVFWGAIEPPAPARDFQAWVYGVLGATMAGWGVFFLFVVHYPFRRQEPWTWNCLAAGLALWYIIDTALSLQYRVYFNAAFNTAVLIAVLAPLLFSRKFFAVPRP